MTTQRAQAASDRLDRAFAALADPSRRGMIDRLSRGPASVSELAEPLAMALPAVLKHLQVLETSGLVASEKAGRVRTYRLEAAALRQLERWVAQRSALWNRRFDRLERFLITDPSPPPVTRGKR
jgi:DNA-binding transcriptional ArsR family regulator